MAREHRDVSRTFVVEIRMLPKRTDSTEGSNLSSSPRDRAKVARFYLALVFGRRTERLEGVSGGLP
jgi:hypothetical protein